MKLNSITMTLTVMN